MKKYQNKTSCFPFFRQSEKTISEQRIREQSLAEEVESAQSRLTTINTELESVVQQLGEARVDKNESSRAQRKAELIDNLKRLYPGVVSMIILMFFQRCDGFCL